jgi:hypothetical protein
MAKLGGIVGALTGMAVAIVFTESSSRTARNGRSWSSGSARPSVG